MNNCKNCQKETKNKVYCSIECQHIGYKKLKVDRVKINCLLCNKEFETLQNKIDNGKKYCSRVCKDSHQKELYIKEGNPVYNIEHTDEWKKWNSERMKKLWETEEHKEKVKIGQEIFFEENGFWVGTNAEACLKRIETNLELYGVDNISRLPETTIKRDETCLKKYGLTSIGVLRNGNKVKNKNTKIEKKIALLLIESGVKFETQYDIFYEKNKFKSYDFYLKDLNLLIEADGDYWHGNPKKYNDLNLLNEIQKNNKLNDEFKNKLALDNHYNIIRFWECEINKKNFKYELFKQIKKYGKREN